MASVRGSACAWLLAALALQACAAHTYALECGAGCTERGNCNPDTGDCQCPYGRVGKACEIDMLSACRIQPESPASCDLRPATSCECRRQCEAFHCREGVCEIPIAAGDRSCYTRDGVPPEKQTSNPPEGGETGVSYYRGWKTDALKEDSNNSSAVQEFMRYTDLETLPLSKCEASCNKRGFCMQYWTDPNARPFCRCHRGFVGGLCEVEDRLCYLGCNGRGKCLEKFFCKCEPPYFSIGCSRSKAAAPTGTLPPAHKLKIYMYELNSREAYHVEQQMEEPREEMGDGLYSSYMQFMEQFLVSPVRTENPSEANLFYIPTFMFSYTKMNKDGNEHLHILLTHLKMNFPYWNRTDGRDHFFFAPADRGGCHLTGLALNPIKVVHFGYHWKDPKTSILGTVQAHGKGEGYSCYHPQRDVMAVTHDTKHSGWSNQSRALSMDDIVSSKTKLLFFMGGTHAYNDPLVPEYSGNSRQILDILDREWKDPEVDLVIKDRGDFPPGFDLEKWYRRSKFCFAPYGWGIGNRLAQAIMCNCIPVIVQERVFQAYEELLPYESFSVRLTNEDLPRIREILRGISAQQYRGMMEALVRYRDAFHWRPEAGGRAFDYTIASLRRRYMNMKGFYY